MLLLCDGSVSLPLRIIIRNISLTAIYPDMWKLANVTPILKKGDKQLIKNYRLNLSFLFVVKCLKKLFSTIFTTILLHITFSAKKQSGFRPGDSTTNQLIDLVNEIHHAFDSTNLFEVRAIFLDIS